MDANKPIYIQVQDIRQMWRELWWKMAGGIKSEYDRIKGTNVFEFYSLFDMWQKEVNKEREKYKTESAQRKKQRHGK